MKVTNILILIVALLICSPFVFSQENIKLELVDSLTDIVAGQKAFYTFKLTNNQGFRDTFMISSEASVYLFQDILDEIEIYPKQLKLDDGESKTFNVTAFTLQDAKSNARFEFIIKIISIGNPIIENSYNVSGFIVSSKDLVQLMPEMPEEIVPNEDFRLKIKFKNKVNSILNDYSISVKSDLEFIDNEFKITLMPFEEKTEELIFRIGNAKPGDYGLNVNVFEGNKIRGSFMGAFTVVKKPLIEEKKDEVKSFLRTKLIISKKNIGNAVAKQKIEMLISGFGNIFTAYRPEPKIENNKLTWEFTLNPGEEYNIEFVTNYRSIFYGFLAIIIFTLLGWLYVDRSVIIKKKIFRIKESADGISELKILLHIRNGSNSVLTNTRIIDLIPNIIEPTQEYGTLKPNTVQKGTYSIRLIWDIGMIESREERVITYKVKAKLKLAGEIILPAAGLHYMKGANLVTVRSARLQLKPKVNIEST